LKFDFSVAALAPSEEFLRAAEEFGLSFDDDDLPRLGRYLAILLAANEQLNLTAITDPAQAWMRHIFDSLTLLPVLAECSPGATVADVGSGGGVPGIPLAITLPELKFTLIESTAKKAEFLRAAAAALRLANVEVLAERAETLAATGSFQRESFDAVVARAVGRMNVVAELCIPLVRQGGRAIFVKGQKAEEELAEALGPIGSLGARHAGTLESPTGRIVVLEKASRTPREYPRRPGEAKKAPLI
jgi:16S rRNA (guanine527-N7)-methyltransferase